MTPLKKLLKSALRCALRSCDKDSVNSAGLQRAWADYTGPQEGAVYSNQENRHSNCPLCRRPTEKSQGFQWRAGSISEKNRLGTGVFTYKWVRASMCWKLRVCGESSVGIKEVVLFFPFKSHLNLGRKKKVCQRKTEEEKEKRG